MSGIHRISAMKLTNRHEFFLLTFRTCSLGVSAAMDSPRVGFSGLLSLLFPSHGRAERLLFLVQRGVLNLLFFLFLS